MLTMLMDWVLLVLGVMITATSEVSATGTIPSARRGISPVDGMPRKAASH